MVYQPGAVLTNVGDSRAYSLTQDGVRQLTVDHSLVQMMIDHGELTPEQALAHIAEVRFCKKQGNEVDLEKFFQENERKRILWNGILV